MVPAILFLAFAGAAFALAKLHLAKPGTPRLAPGAHVALGDSYRGEVIFSQTCAKCHGEGGKGGGIGPRLRGNPVPLPVAKATIESGRGPMPANLVTGQKERDVLAYLATILGQ